MAGANQTAYKSTLYDLDKCEITWGRFNHFTRHTHDGLMLSIIDAGQQQLEHNGKHYTANPGSVVAVAPEESHSSSMSKAQSWVFRSLIVPNQLSERLTGNQKSHYLCDISINNALLSSKLNEFFQSIPENNILTMESLLTEVLGHLFTHHRKDKSPVSVVGKEKRAVHSARDFLADNLDKNVSLTELANAANMDGFHLNRAFKKHFGLPPHTWHRQFRVKHAQALLTSGVLTLDVAFLCGFADQAHFCRTFKKVTGISPAKFAEQQMNSNRFQSLADLSSI